MNFCRARAFKLRICIKEEKVYIVDTQEIINPHHILNTTDYFKIKGTVYEFKEKGSVIYIFSCGINKNYLSVFDTANNSLIHEQELGDYIFVLGDEKRIIRIYDGIRQQISSQK